jgi:hypothetical protein
MRVGGGDAQLVAPAQRQAVADGQQKLKDFPRLVAPKERAAVGGGRAVSVQQAALVAQVQLAADLVSV